MDNSEVTTKNHEEFSVETEKPKRGARTPSKLVRQDRYEIEQYDCIINIQDSSYEVLNYSTFGLAIFSEKPIQAKELQGIPLRINGFEVALLNLLKVREEALGENGFKIAFEIAGEPLNISRINAVIKSQEVITRGQQSLKEKVDLPVSFKVKVYEIKDFLEGLEESINNLAKSETFKSQIELQVFENTISEVIADYLKNIFEPAYDDLSKHLDTLNDDQLKASFEFFRSKLKHLIYQSPLSERIFSKPLGYAGDFEMMNYIYRGEEVGNSLFAKCLHRYYVNHPNARAVRNRSNYLNEWIFKAYSKQQNQGKAKILSVACGPAMELQMLLEKDFDPNLIEAHLLDQDIGALREAQRKLKELSRKTGKLLDVHFFHKAIRNVIIEGLTHSYDLIYSAGLFDYFSDPVAKMAAKKLYDALKPGGALVIGNFTGAARNRALMELALDWNLIYRDENDLLKLYEGIANKTTVESEPEKINLFVVLRK